MNPGALPIIRLEVEGVRHAIIHAFAESQFELTDFVAAAVTEFCTPERVTKIVQAKTKEVVDAVIREEIDRFFRYGKGREVIREAVNRMLDKDVGAWAAECTEKPAPKEEGEAIKESTNEADD